MKLRELPKEFEKKGVRYTQMEKNDVYVLYRCEALDYKDVYYEVFKPKIGLPHPLDMGGWDAVECGVRAMGVGRGPVGVGVPRGCGWGVQRGGCTEATCWGAADLLRGKGRMSLKSKATL